MDKQFECKDCEQIFTSAEAFVNHFERTEGSINIIGCLTAEVLTDGQSQEDEASVSSF